MVGWLLVMVATWFGSGAVQPLFREMVGAIAKLYEYMHCMLCNVADIGCRGIAQDKQGSTGGILYTTRRVDGIDRI